MFMCNAYVIMYVCIMYGRMHACMWSPSIFARVPLQLCFLLKPQQILMQFDAFLCFSALSPTFHGNPYHIYVHASFFFLDNIEIPR